jgi:hypothetical protein
MGEKQDRYFGSKKEIPAKKGSNLPPGRVVSAITAW